MGIEELQGRALINAISNYIDYIESDMNPETWKYVEEDITLEELVYNIKQFEFDKTGTIL